jgi:hypothetical protein
MLDMVDVTPSCRTFTTIPDTTPVPGCHRSPLRSTPHPGFPSHIKNLRIRIENYPGDGGVTGEHADGVHVEDPPIVDRLMDPTGNPLQGGKVGEHLNLGTFPTRNR